MINVSCGLTSRDQFGEGLANQPTRIITNMAHAPVVLQRRCTRDHRHVHLVHGRAAEAQRYPEDLCQAIIECLDLETNSSSLMEVAEVGLHEEVPVQDEWHFDENDGSVLDPEKTKKGIARELEKLKARMVYKAVDRTEAQQDPDGKFIKTRWVKTNKGDEVRCRFVAQEIAAGDPRSDLFAGTPPLFAARLLVSLAAMNHHRGWRILGLDVACAFLYADCVRKLYIELPEMDKEAKSGNKVGLLLKALYGTRDAPKLWQEELKKTMEELGFESSALHPCVFWHQEMELFVIAHVDDLLAFGGVVGTEMDEEPVGIEI